MARFILKILAADISKGWRDRFGASSVIPVKRHRLIIALNQRESIVASIGFEYRFHILALRCIP